MASMSIYKDLPASVHKIGSIVSMILYIKQNINCNGSILRIDGYIKTLIKVLNEILRNETELKLYRRVKRAKLTLATAQFALTGMIAEEQVSSRILDTVCAALGLLMKMVPFEKWAKNSRVFLLRVLSIKFYNEESGKFPYQSALPILLCARVLMGSLLARKLGLEQKVDRSWDWIDEGKCVINEKNLNPILCTDEDIIRSLRKSFGSISTPSDLLFEKEIYQNSLPLIVPSIEITFNTKHKELRGLALDCIYSFVGWLDSWSHFDESMPALSSALANTLSSGRHISYECVIGCIRNIEVIICRCLGDSVLQHLIDNPNDRGKTRLHYMDSSDSFEKHLKECQGNIIKVCRIVSDFKNSDDANVRMAVSDFLGSVCYYCNRILEPYCLDAFSVLMLLAEDANQNVAVRSRENIHIITNTRSMETIISSKIFPLVESLPLMESHDIKSIAEKIYAIDGIIGLLPTTVPCMGLLLERVVSSIIDVSARKDIELMTHGPDIARCEMGSESLYNRTEPEYIRAKMRYEPFFKPFERLISRIASANSSSLSTVIELVVPFLDVNTYSKRHQESGTWIVFSILNALKPPLDPNKVSAVTDIMEILYPVVAPRRVSRVISGDYNEDSDKDRALSPISRVCVVNILNCLSAACRALKTQTRPVLLPKWLYVALNRLNHTDIDIDIAARNAICSVAKEIGLVQGSFSHSDAIEALITSYADHILNTSVSMLLSPDPCIEAFYLALSVIKCRGSGQLRYLNNVLDEILFLTAKLWCGNVHTFDALILIIDALSEKLVELCLGSGVREVRGLLWKGLNDTSNKTTLELTQLPYGGSASSIPDAASDVGHSTSVIAKTLADSYKISTPLITTCSAKFQEFFIKYAKTKPTIPASHGTLSNPNTFTEKSDKKLEIQPQRLREDLQLYQKMALKILSILHRYAGSYRVYVRKTILTSICRLTAIFIHDPEKVLPDIHNKWECVTNRLYDKFPDVVLSAAQCILVMCQVDPGFVTKKINKSVFPHILEVVRRSEIEYKKVALAQINRTRSQRSKDLSRAAVNSAPVSPGDTTGLLLDLAAEIVKSNVILTPLQDVHEILLIAFKLMNTNSYTVDLLSHARGFIEALLHLPNNPASDYAWLLSWVALGARRCLYQPRSAQYNLEHPSNDNSHDENIVHRDMGTLELCAELPKWFVEVHRSIDVPNIKYKTEILKLILNSEKSLTDSVSNEYLQKMLKTHSLIPLRNNSVVWELQ